MFIKELTMRIEDYFRCAIGDLSEKTIEDIKMYADEEQLDFLSDHHDHIQDAYLEIEMWKGDKSCNIVYYFDDYETLLICDEPHEVFAIMNDFIEKYADICPDNSDCLGDDDYFESPEVKLFNLLLHQKKVVDRRLLLKNMKDLEDKMTSGKFYTLMKAALCASRLDYIDDVKVELKLGLNTYTFKNKDFIQAIEKSFIYVDKEEPDNEFFIECV